MEGLSIEYLAQLALRARAGEIALEEEGERLQCSSCLVLLTAIVVAEAGYACPFCGSRVCVICGCTEERACPGGCSWVAPGICSSHREELDRRVSEVFGEVITR